MAGALNKRTAIVTGASAGIGRATSLALAKEGAAVVASARREEKLTDLVQEIEAAGGRALAAATDASKETEIDKLIAKAREFADAVGGTLDIFIVNAGRGLAGGLLSSDPAKWREMYELNVLGAAFLMRRAGELLAPHGRGDIVVLGSLSGHHISPFSGFYGGSKFAVAGMAEAFRREICAKGVRVTTIKPGVVESEFQENAGYTAENFYKVVAHFGKLLEPADVAETIRYVVTRPAHVHVSDIIIRTARQDYP
jgi:NADP-dependent 3-hydroxy acid dehydrogenase YdfG